MGSSEGGSVGAEVGESESEEEEEEETLGTMNFRGALVLFPCGWGQKKKMKIKQRKGIKR